MSKKSTRISNNIVILGIDPGFARLGFAVVRKKDGIVSLLEAGTVETRTGDLHEKRLFSIHEAIERVAKQWHPDILSIEKIFFASNQKTAIPVAEARGIVLLTAARHGITVYEYAPPEMKRSVTGSGSADKKAVQKIIQITFKLADMPKLDDTTDAIGLALAAAYDIKKELFSQSGREKTNT
ncbi:MAG: crossover junction endodeoxyribonuclease RuvC [Patescibacteria group bacterium]